MSSNPARKFGFAYVAGRNGQHRHHAIGIGGIKGMSIQNQEQFHGNKRGPFVAVKKRVVSADAIPVHSGKIAAIGIGVRRQLRRPR